MTILPKKKPSKDKNDPETQDHSLGHSHSLSHHPSATDPRHERHARSRNSPPRWHGPTTRDDKMTACDPGGGFEATHDGSANHNKRRHRSSPHRNVRKHRGHGSTTHPSHTTVKGPVGGATVGPSPTEYEDAESGCNSGDEHHGPPIPHESNNIDELERVFEQTLKEKKGFLIKKMGEDGACLFRSVADQVYGDQEMHTVVRKHCIDYMSKNMDYFRHYVTEDFNTYLNRKRMDHCHGNHVEMQAMCEIYNRPIEVYQYSIEPINTFHGAYKTDNEPIRICYHRNVHYNSVVDPYKPTVGVGLGLPGHQPGLADKNQMSDAVNQSEESHLEMTMLQDKLRETDWEVTQDTIEEQVARESYLQWLRDQEKRAKRQGSPRSASATCSSASEPQQLENVGSPEARGGRSPRNRSAANSAQNSPHRMESDSGPGSPRMTEVLPLPASAKPRSPQCQGSPVLGAVGGSSSPRPTEMNVDFQETTSIMNHLPPSLFGISEWEEDDILAQVIAQSQQEYLDSLKKNAGNTSGGHGSSNHGSSNPGSDGACNYPNLYGPSTSNQDWSKDS